MTLGGIRVKMEKLNLIATSTFGLEAVVKRELETLGYTGKVSRPGSIAFEGDEAAIFRANIFLRTAERVLICLGQFEAKDFGELFDRTYELPWQRWLGVDASFPVICRTVGSQLSSEPACQSIVKKAIAKKLQDLYRIETMLPETGPRYIVKLSLLNDQAMLSIDTTGTGLHKRGYRPLRSQAPLRETIAAAMVSLSFWKPDRPLIDPFCGSGTIPIEAAMIGRNIAPGLKRTFAAEDWPQLPASLASNARNEARDLILPNISPRIIGTDIDKKVLDQARYHATHAEVGGDIHFQQLSFAELTSRREHGCVICNPPYGLRIGTREDVRYIYRSMPDDFRQLPTWSHYILTPWPEFEKLIGQPADRRRKIYNGNIECTYYQFHGPQPPKASAHDDPAAANTTTKQTSTNIDSQAEMQSPPAFGGLRNEANRQAEMFANKLTKTARHLRKWPRRGITCYRLYDRDIPEIPLTVDRYENCLHIAEYNRPHDRTAAQHGDWLDMLATTAATVLEIPRANVFMKRRSRQRGTSQYEKLESLDRTIIVREGGLKFKVNLSDYLDTGLFLDHRITRGMVRDAAANRRVLNLFAYTGAFSVYAAAGGAKSVTTVDMSNTYLDWARANLASNGYCGEQFQFVSDDAAAFLQYHKQGPCYDLAVIDPPTFSNSTRTEKDFEIQRDHAELLNGLIKIMSHGAPIFFSTNFRRFKLNADAIHSNDIREITRQTIPPDFRDRKIHRCWLIVK
jgi:23S rRNA (guanine2445-N2)-methyltransferase / 23S rRNA (guanine2069-N7)-methyltransferase